MITCYKNIIPSLTLRGLRLGKVLRMPRKYFRAKMHSYNTSRIPFYYEQAALAPARQWLILTGWEGWRRMGRLGQGTFIERSLY